jgi:hypothetical protein
MKKLLLIIYIALAGVTIIQLQSCKKDKNENPMVQTLDLTAPLPDKFILTGSIVSTGNLKVLDYGFVYNNSSLIDENNGTKVSLGADAPQGDFTKELNALTFKSPSGTGSLLYVRSYLTNEKGTVYGRMLSVIIPVVATSNISPQSGKSGDRITISGQFYITDASQAEVTFNGIKAVLKEVSSTKIVAEVPSGIVALHYSQIPLQVSIRGQKLGSPYGFTLLANFKDFTPKSGLIGTFISFTGENMPNLNTYGNIRVLLGQTEVYPTYTSSGFQVAVPASVTTDKLTISIISNGQTTVLPSQFILTPPTITSITPASGLPGSSFTITGTNLNTNYGYGLLGGVSANSYNYTGNNTALTVTVPSNLSAGEHEYVFKTGPFSISAPQKFTVIAPAVTSFLPTSGTYGREVNITGTFVSGSYYDVYFGSVYTSGRATSSTNLQTYVPYSSTGSTVKISVRYNNGQTLVAPGDFSVL